MSLPDHLARPLDVLMIDNFDSFTWNLYQHLTLLGADITVIRNDAIPSECIPQLQIRSLIISPGPGHPITDSGISRDAIRHFSGRVPILGVCMGLECVVDVFGGEIRYAEPRTLSDDKPAHSTPHASSQLRRRNHARQTKPNKT
jgi:anthranilate synthase/indole-3-glycerol phosphate synthase/phosphoribosylanthranilate isomerase